VEAAVRFACSEGRKHGAKFTHVGCAFVTALVPLFVIEITAAETAVVLGGVAGIVAVVEVVAGGSSGCIQSCQVRVTFFDLGSSQIDVS